MAQAEASTTSLSPDELREAIPSTAFAFRGYNVKNLGLSPELLEHPAYGPLLGEFLDRGSVCCSQLTGRTVDLTTRVRQRRETSLATYDEAIALTMTVELAHLEMLRQFHGIDMASGQVAFGFSLGEIASLVASHVLNLEDALRVLLAMTDDCVELAKDVTLGVLFSRRAELPQDSLFELCQDINSEGNGVIGVSALLAPNSVLVIGQGQTMDRLSQRKKDLSEERVYLRRNEHRWPPLHTPIVWQRNIPNRTQHLMHTMRVNHQPPSPPIFSLVTGSLQYHDHNVREIMGFWIDRPQRLWDAVNHTLSEGVEAVIHVGPGANIIPATFDRLASNVAAQTKESMSMRALSGMVSRPWLQAILPRRTALLRAPQIRQVRLEEWLLENDPA